MAQDPVDIYTGGVDTYLGKKAYLTVYYSLSAGKGNVFSRPLGDPTVTTGADAFLLDGHQCRGQLSGDGQSQP